MGDAFSKHVRSGCCFFVGGQAEQNVPGCARLVYVCCFPFLHFWRDLQFRGHLFKLSNSNGATHRGVPFEKKHRLAVDARWKKTAEPVKEVPTAASINVTGRGM